MSILQMETYPVETFTRSPDLDAHLSHINDLKTGERYEFILPAESNILLFVSELSLLPYDGEYSGVADRLTGSVIVQKGYNTGAGTSGMDAHASYVSERIKRTEARIDDILFHTHPFSPDDSVRQRRNPLRASMPSDSDNGTVLTLKDWADSVGLEWGLVNMIGSGGAVSLTEATGIKIDEGRLRDAGLKNTAIIKIQQRLQLYPPVYFKNYCREGGREQEFVQKGIDLYHALAVRPLSNKDKNALIDRFIDENRGQIRTGLKRGEPLFMGDELKRDILTTPIEYPSDNILFNLGLTQQQRELTRELIGLRTETYVVTAGIGAVRASPPAETW